MKNHAMQSSGNQTGTSIERKLLLMLFVVAVLPITILGATIATGMFQFEAIIATVVAQFAGLAMAYVFISGIVRQATSIRETLASINNGDFEARAANITNDELGGSAIALNAMCDSTLNLIQSNDERDEIQTSIEALNSEMEAIAAGDLTITTDVKNDMTGSIADSVNRMTQQLRSIVQQVQSAAQQVTTSSTRIRESSTTMSNDTDAQAQRIGEASGQLLEMTDSFQNMAELTQESVQVAVEARQTASKGLQAVSDTVDGMQRIRNQVQNTSKRIKRFGESSQEIGEIVQLISDITDRTSILALNASIQAAMAGDAGQGFAVVAEEIERLAESSKDATQQISKLIRGIQHETSEVISDMEESTREVVAGSQLASEAGETLFEIDSVSNQLVELIQTSSTYALQQAETATKVASSMSEISLSTKASAEKSREATRSVGKLADRVSQLRDSVSKFKVSVDGEIVLQPQVPDFDAPIYPESENAGRVDTIEPNAKVVNGSDKSAMEVKPKSKKRIVPPRNRRLPQTMVVDERHLEVSDAELEAESKSIEENLLSNATEAREMLKKIKTADLDEVGFDQPKPECTPDLPQRAAQTLFVDQLTQESAGESERGSVVETQDSSGNDSNSSSSRTVCASIDADTLRQLRDARKILRGSDSESGADEPEGMDPSDEGTPVKKVSETITLDDE